MLPDLGRERVSPPVREVVRSGVRLGPWNWGSDEGWASAGLRVPEGMAGLGRADELVEAEEDLRLRVLRFHLWPSLWVWKCASEGVVGAEFSPPWMVWTRVGSGVLRPNRDSKEFRDR